MSQSKSLKIKNVRKEKKKKNGFWTGCYFSQNICSQNITVAQWNNFLLKIVKTGKKKIKNRSLKIIIGFDFPQAEFDQHLMYVY